MPIASLTKLMTAILAVQHTHPRDMIRITKDALNYRGQGVGVLPKGKRVRLETLLNGLLIVSGNDTAIALADHVAGSQRRFVNAMNRWARRLHLGCTHFADVYGLNPGSRSCARDLAVLARLDMRSRRIRRIVRRSKVVFRFPVKSHRIWLYGHNPLMEIHYKGTIGLKTGFTDPAGRCFVGVVRRRGHTLTVVLLHSTNPARHAPALLDRGFRYEA
jgi:D-alanyl-D-alanine carboxypeptidase (penicillin-binding protein 5/6)